MPGLPDVLVEAYRALAAVDEAAARLRSLAKVVVRRTRGRGVPYVTVYLPPQPDPRYLEELVDASRELAKAERAALGPTYALLGAAAALPGGSGLQRLAEYLRRELAGLDRAERRLPYAASSGSAFELSRAARRYATRAARIAALVRLAVDQAAALAGAQQPQAQAQERPREA